MAPRPRSLDGDVLGPGYGPGVHVETWMFNGEISDVDRDVYIPETLAITSAYAYV